MLLCGACLTSHREGMPPAPAPAQIGPRHVHQAALPPPHTCEGDPVGVGRLQQVCHLLHHVLHPQLCREGGGWGPEGAGCWEGGRGQVAAARIHFSGEQPSASRTVPTTVSHSARFLQDSQVEEADDPPPPPPRHPSAQHPYASPPHPQAAPPTHHRTAPWRPTARAPPGRTCAAPPESGIRRHEGPVEGRSSGRRRWRAPAAGGAAAPRPR